MGVLDRLFKNEGQNQSQEPNRSEEIQKKMTNLRDRINARHHPGTHKAKGATLDGIPYGASHVQEIEEALKNNDGKKLDEIKERLLQEAKERCQRA